MYISKDQGITLVVLVTTIVIMLILVGVSVTTGMKTYESAEVYKFVTQMQLIQKKVDNVAQEIKRFSTDIEIQQYLLEQYTIELSSKGNVTNRLDYQSRIKNIISKAKEEQEKQYVEAEDENFIYFTSSELAQCFELDNLTEDDEFIINFKTREVISLIGIKYEGIIYYTQYSSVIPNGQMLIQYNNNFDIPSFSFEQTEMFGLNANIVVNALNSFNVTIKYREEDSSQWSSIEKFTSNTQLIKIPITKSANYIVKLVNRDGQSSTEKNINIILTNSPKLQNALLPIKSNGTPIDDINTGIWYNYSIGTVDYETSSHNYAYAYSQQKLKTYVWIPRFAYNSSLGNKIKFLKGNSNLPTDNSNINILNDKQDTSWSIPDTLNNLTGIWVEIKDTDNKATLDLISIVNDTTREIISVL